MKIEIQAFVKPLVILAGLALALGLGFPEGAQAQAKLKVGIIHIGSMTDGGYNQAHAEGIAIMKKNLPEVEVIEVENVPETADAERVMESMIKQGAKLIFAASFGYLDPALRVAKKYPEVKFVHPAGYKRAPNLTTYWASTPEAFYLMGIAAGRTTKTNKMGFVCALPVSFFLPTSTLSTWEPGRSTPRWKPGSSSPAPSWTPGRKPPRPMPSWTRGRTCWG